jgi:hypothetical protein
VPDEHRTKCNIKNKKCPSQTDIVSGINNKITIGDESFLLGVDFSTLTMYSKSGGTSRKTGPSVVVVARVVAGVIEVAGVVAGVVAAFRTILFSG